MQDKTAPQFSLIAIVLKRKDYDMQSPSNDAITFFVIGLCVTIIGHLNLNFGASKLDDADAEQKSKKLCKQARIYGPIIIIFSIIMYFSAMMTGK